jgi:hypothetical protein
MKSINTIPAIKARLLIAIFFILCGTSFGRDTLFVWVGGTFNGSTWNNTITVDPGEWIDVPVYLRGGTPHVYAADLCLPLGIQKAYADSFNAAQSQIFYPFTNWDGAYFTNFNDEYEPGWASLSFVGLSRISPPYDNPYFHSDTVFLGFVFRIQTTDNINLLGRRICNALGSGLDPVQGIANAGDTLGSGIGYEVFQRFACIQFGPPGCSYVAGDANGSNTFTGLDVTYSVRYFKGGPHPSFSCDCPPHGTWYVSGDVNGSCTFSGLDVTYMVRYFKGGPGPIPCADCPPGGLLAPPNPDIEPIKAPVLKQRSQTDTSN